MKANVVHPVVEERSQYDIILEVLLSYGYYVISITPIRGDK